MAKSLYLSSFICLVASTTVRPQKISRDTTNGEGSCPSAKLPTEEQFVYGFTDVCDRFIEGYGMHRIKHDDPLRATITLNNADSSTSDWVYKISILNDKGSEVHNVDRTMCKNQFQMYLDGNKGLDGSGETGLGKTYCVVDGTGGDRVDRSSNGQDFAKSGQGKVAMLGTGKTWISGLGEDKKAMMTFESYDRDSGTSGGNSGAPTDCGNILC